jgi:Domain of unknown function DUF29
VSRKNKKSLGSQLVRLMMHIIKWLTQSWKRTKSWYDSIKSARDEIDDLLNANPSLKSQIDSLIEDNFEKAKKEAEEEMGIDTQITELSRKQLFEDEYKLEE